MATAAAAVVARARRDVVSHFMQANAVSADSASTWIRIGPLQQRALARFIHRGVIVGDGQGYLLSRRARI